MKPVYKYAGYRTFDLTEIKFHRLKAADGSMHLFACWPKKWDKSPPTDMQTLTRGVVVMCAHDVTEWHEVDLGIELPD